VLSESFDFGLQAAGCALWVVGCGLWVVGCGFKEFYHLIVIDDISNKQGPYLKDSRSDQRKETNERRTSNVQHRTSNNVFYLF